MMSKKYFIFLLLNFFVVENLFAQKEDRNWVFGDSVGIDFNNLANPTIFNSGEFHNDETEACISDSSGQLLFYINGMPLSMGNWQVFTCIYNRNHEVMVNSDSLFAHYSLSNGCVIIPSMEQSNQYYVFYIGFHPDSSYLKCFYSIVDMNLDSGLGGVVEKNILLSNDTMTEKITAIKHGNGRDWWIVSHEIQSSIYVSYLFDPFGIHGPFYQSIGSFSDYYAWQGEMLPSKNGEKLLYIDTYGVVDVFDFNRCSGLLSNWKELGEPPYDTYKDYYGGSFSPSGNILYVSTFEKLYKYDLSSTNPLSSKTQIWNVSGPSIMQHELAPDNKIYIASYYGGPQTSYDTVLTHLTVIESPDSFNNCNLNPYSFSLNGKRTYAGLPNMPNYNLGVLEGSTCDTIELINSTGNLKTKSVVNISPNPATTEIKITNLSPTENQISIINLLGQQVKSIRVSHVQSTIIPVSDLPAGIYVVTIFDGEKIVCKKFVRE